MYESVLAPCCYLKKIIWIKLLNVGRGMRYRMHTQFTLFFHLHVNLFIYSCTVCAHIYVYYSQGKGAEVFGSDAYSAVHGSNTEDTDKVIEYARKRYDDLAVKIRDACVN